jgi:Arc/MetJ-type ribon-helix-helix transcriptional regulator
MRCYDRQVEVKLSERAAAIVAEQVAAGRYRSIEEAVEAGVAMLDDDGGMDIDAILEANREALLEGERALDRGDSQEVTPEFIQALRDRIASKSRTT